MWCIDTPACHRPAATRAQDQVTKYGCPNSRTCSSQFSMESLTHLAEGFAVACPYLALYAESHMQDRGRILPCQLRIDQRIVAVGFDSTLGPRRPTGLAGPPQRKELGLESPYSTADP